MADDSPDPSFRKAAAAYRSAGQLRSPPPAPQIVRLVEQPGALPAPLSAAKTEPTGTAVPSLASPQSAITSTPSAANPSGGVSLMITNAQKDSLRRLGLSEVEIRDMTPAEAHRRLGLTER